MQNIWKITISVAAWVVLAGAVAAAPSGRISVMIRSADVEAHAGPESSMGQYYVVQYAPPEGLEAGDVQRAILELYVNVEAKERDEYVNEAPVIEVFALTESPVGSVSLENLDRPTRASRPVARGEGRHVRIDVTSIVRAHASGDLVNYGIAIGSLSGMREGDITFVENMFPGGAIGRLTIYVGSPAK